MSYRKVKYDQIVDLLRGTYRRFWGWANLPIDPATGANLIAFTSGSGNGDYASYFGFDADGGLVCLVTDFLILPLPEHFAPRAR